MKFIKQTKLGHLLCKMRLAYLYEFHFLYKINYTIYFYNNFREIKSDLPKSGIENKFIFL